MPSRVDEQLQWLRRRGTCTATLRWKRRDLAVLVGDRPTDAGRSGARRGRAIAAPSNGPARRRGAPALFAASTGVPATRTRSALPAARGMSKPSALARWNAQNRTEVLGDRGAGDEVELGSRRAERPEPHVHHERRTRGRRSRRSGEQPSSARPRGAGGNRRRTRPTPYRASRTATTDRRRRSATPTRTS